jgi:hypothetical protein
LIGLHLFNTGHGAAWADRWPVLRALYVEVGKNGALAGDSSALTPAMIREVVVGFIEALAAFVPLLQETFLTQGSSVQGMSGAIEVGV